MTDVTSEKLYSKLDRINNIKRNLKSVMTEIGGYEYFENDPKFEEYPAILSQIQATIRQVNAILDNVVFGKELESPEIKANTTYNKIIPYLENLEICRNQLIANLNTAGVISDTDETLIDLINKILLIPKGSEPFREVVRSMFVDSYRFDFVYFGEYSGNTFRKGLAVDLVNTTADNVYLSDPGYAVYLYDPDIDIDLTNFFIDDTIIRHSGKSLNLMVTGGSFDDEDVTTVINNIRNNYSYISIDPIYTENSSVMYFPISTTPGLVIGSQPTSTYNNSDVAGELVLWVYQITDARYLSYFKFNLKSEYVNLLNNGCSLETCFLGYSGREYSLSRNQGYTLTNGKTWWWTIYASGSSYYDWTNIDSGSFYIYVDYN